MSLVAGHLLDANDEQKVGKGLPEEYKANLRKNVADAIGILSKLTTGIDVNVRFHDVKGFEFTDEIAIFDLMDISLVHGWLVDPEVTPYFLCLLFAAQQYTYLQRYVQLQHKVRNNVHLHKHLCSCDNYVVYTCSVVWCASCTKPLSLRLLGKTFADKDKR